MVRTFFTMEGGDSEFANFTLPTLKTILEAVVRMRDRMPQNAFFPRTRDLLVSRKIMQRHLFSTLHPLLPGARYLVAVSLIK